MLRFGFTCCISIKKEEVSYFPKMYKVKLGSQTEMFILFINVYIYTQWRRLVLIWDKFSSCNDCCLDYIQLNR